MQDHMIFESCEVAAVSRIYIFLSNLLRLGTTMDLNYEV